MLFFVTTSYMDVIKYYTTAGGSYVVARDNFGPKIAQIAAVALLIDYTVTVAVQCSAGTAALTSALPGLRHAHPLLSRSVSSCPHLRQPARLEEAGSYFAFPTYFYILMMSATIVFGVYKKIAGTLNRIPLPLQKDLIDHHLGSKGTGVLMGSRSSRCCAPTPTAARR